MLRTTSLLLFALAACAAPGPRAARDSAVGANANSPLVGKPLPELPGVRRRDGVPLRARAGAVLILDFWATYCEPCKRSFPELEQLYRKHASRGFDVVAIAVEADSPGIDAFLRQTGVSFPVAIDAGESVFSPPLSINKLPTSILVDRAGRVRFHHQGTVAPADLEAEILLLLDEPTK